MRIIARGISPENVESWKDKFKSFQIQDIYYNPHKSLFFATTQNPEFISTFNGIKWKGDELLVQESLFPPYIPPLVNASTTLDSGPLYPLEPLTESKTLDIKDSLRDKGWTLGKFNRKIAIFKTRDPKTKRIKTINPENYRNNYFRFPDSQDRFRSIVDISWPIETIDEISQDETVETSSEDESCKDKSEYSQEMSLKKDLKVVINAKSLRDLVFPENDSKETGNLFSFIQDPVSNQDIMEDVEPEIQENVIKSLSSSRLFFMHLDKEGEYDLLFKRDLDWDEKEWEEKRSEYTILFKKRHKDATRRRSRYSSLKK